jgi:hypothetical protein
LISFFLSYYFIFTYSAVLPKRKADKPTPANKPTPTNKPTPSNKPTPTKEQGRLEQEVKARVQMLKRTETKVFLLSWIVLSFIVLYSIYHLILTQFAGETSFQTQHTT